MEHANGWTSNSNYAFNITRKLSAINRTLELHSLRSLHSVLAQLKWLVVKGSLPLQFHQAALYLTWNVINFHINQTRAHKNIQNTDTEVQYLGSSQQHCGVFLEHCTGSSQVISELRVLQLLLSLGSLTHQLRGIAAKSFYVI